MKVTKFVDVEAEVEVEVSMQDIVRELPRTAESQREVLSGLSTCIGFFSAIPDDLLAGLNEKQHAILMEHIDKIQARFAAIEPVPMPQAATA